MTSPAFDQAVKASTSNGGTSITSSGFFDHPASANSLLIYVTYAWSTGSPTTTITYNNITGKPYTFTPVLWDRTLQTHAPGMTMITELWVAPYNLDNNIGTVTATFSSTVRDASIVVTEFSGTLYPAAPFDNSPTLPSTALTTTATTPPTLTYSTLNADDYLIFASSSIVTGSIIAATGTTPSGWTLLANTSSSDATSNTATRLTVYGLSVSSIQTGATIVDGSSNNAYWTGIVTAITADQNKWVGTLTGTSILSGVGFAKTGAAGVLKGASVLLGIPASYGSSFSQFQSYAFVDWGSTDYSSYLYCSQAIPQYSRTPFPLPDGRATNYNRPWPAAGMRFNTPYVYTFLKEDNVLVEDNTGQTVYDNEGTIVTSSLGGMMAQAYWDWANDTASVRVTPAQECYNYRSGYLTTCSRIKLRGRGKSVQMYYSSEPGKNFQLAGYALYFSANSMQ